MGGTENNIFYPENHSGFFMSHLKKSTGEAEAEI